jgi:hypothetical protein
MTPEKAIAILKADDWILTRDQSHAMAQALESALKAERERATQSDGERLLKLLGVLK